MNADERRYGLKRSMNAECTNVNDAQSESLCVFRHLIYHRRSSAADLMEADERRWRLDQITERIIGCVYQVSNVLGAGYLEKIYENALALELGLNDLRVGQQQRIEVRYREVLVGDFVADLLVEECVIVEIKAIRALEDIHTAQCVNYLKATGLQVCLLVNFGTSKATVKRVVYGF